MSADLSISIDIKGSFEELLSMLKVLKVFETEKFEQYNKDHDCGYIESVTVCDVSEENHTERLKDLNELNGQTLIDFLSSHTFSVF